jgi:hypothetical protein
VWSRRNVLAIFGFGLVLILAGAGFALWQGASDGEKQAELGSSMLGGAIVGVALLVVERLWTQTTEQNEVLIGRRASAAPSAGKQDEEEVTQTPEADAAEPFAVVYEGWIRDTSRIDAWQARLRVFRSDEYFQFVTAVASGPDLVLLRAEEATSPGRFRRAFAEAAVPSIRDAVTRGEIPLEDPTRAYEVFPDVRAAMRHAAASVDEISQDEVVARFRADGSGQ